MNDTAIVFFNFILLCLVIVVHICKYYLLRVFRHYTYIEPNISGDSRHDFYHQHQRKSLMRRRGSCGQPQSHKLVIGLGVAQSANIPYVVFGLVIQDTVLERDQLWVRIHSSINLVGTITKETRENYTPHRHQ